MTTVKEIQKAIDESIKNETFLNVLPNVHKLYTMDGVCKTDLRMIVEKLMRHKISKDFDGKTWFKDVIIHGVDSIVNSVVFGWCMSGFIKCTNDDNDQDCASDIQDIENSSQTEKRKTRLSKIATDIFALSKLYCLELHVALCASCKHGKVNLFGQLWNILIEGKFMEDVDDVYWEHMPSQLADLAATSNVDDSFTPIVNIIISTVGISKEEMEKLLKIIVTNDAIYQKEPSK